MSKPTYLALTSGSVFMLNPSTSGRDPMYGVMHHIEGNGNYNLNVGGLGNTNCCGAMSLTGVLMKNVAAILSFAKMGRSIILFLGWGGAYFANENMFPELVQEANKKMEGILEIVYEQLDKKEHLLMFYPKDAQKFNMWVNT